MRGVGLSVVLAVVLSSNARLQKERKDDADRIERGFQLALGRAATKDEIAAALDYLTKTRTGLGETEAWESFARVVFMSNEFVYVNCGVE